MAIVGLPAFAIHPGEILVEEFMKPLGLTQKALAERIGVSFRRINEICKCKRSISAETALLFGKVFSTRAEFWMNLQSIHDLVLAKQKANLKPIRPFCFIGITNFIVSLHKHLKVDAFSCFPCFLGCIAYEVPINGVCYTR